MLRRCLILASLIAAPAAQAQFATFIPPKPKVPDSVAAVTAARQKAKADSATAARIANMKTWVDSAAGLPPRSTITTDSVLVPGDTIPVLVATAHGRTSSTPPSSETRAETHTETPAKTRTRTHNGARAPATASDLPLLLVVGSLSLFAGLVLFAGTPRPRHHA